MPEIVKTDRHVLIRGLSVRADALINTIAGVRNVTKWEVIRDALEEYAERHKTDITKAIDGVRK